MSSSASIPSSINSDVFSRLPAGSALSGAISQTGRSESYTDFASLAKLRAKAGDDSPEIKAEATKEVAKQFESLFLQMMLKSMREATYVDESSQSEQTQFYQEMFDKQIALDLSNRESGGIGLAAIMQRQLGGVQGEAGTNSAEHTLHPVNTLKPLDTGMVRGRIPVAQVTGVLQQTQTDIAPRASAKTEPSELRRAALNTEVNTIGAADKHSATLASGPQAFTEAVWPHAIKAAEKLGVKPEVLVAQSALETGWGEKMIHDAYGNSANNLFGIKADHRWTGQQVSVSTLEYRDGVAEKEQASFRAYASLTESFDDYARFLQSSPRYQDALEHAGNSQYFLERLQQAGYSTDPAYAEKIQSITKRQSFQQTIDALKQTNAMQTSANNNVALAAVAKWGGDK